MYLIFYDCLIWAATEIDQRHQPVARVIFNGKPSPHYNRVLAGGDPTPSVEAGVEGLEIELQYLDGRKFSLKEETQEGLKKSGDL